MKNLVLGFLVLTLALWVVAGAQAYENCPPARVRFTKETAVKGPTACDSTGAASYAIRQEPGGYPD